MYNTKENITKCINLLSEYKGDNPYIRLLYDDIIINGDLDKLNEFSIEYILKNYEYKFRKIDKVIKIADWYAKSKIDSGRWVSKFIPEKIEVCSLLGETDSSYHCYIRYKRNMDPIQAFLQKKAVLTNFTLDDYHDLEVDFDRYDRLSTNKDPNRRLKGHQKEAVKFLLSRKKCVLAHDMGLGKSTSLSVAAIEGNFDAVLIVCPASIKTNWKDELMWYVPERDITIIEGYLGKNKAELEEYLGYKPGKSGKKVSELQEEAREVGKWSDNRFVIVNFDILDEFYKIPATRSKANIEKAFNESPMLKYIANKKSLIIIDEAHRLSNRKSGRYKVIKGLINRGKPDSIYLSTGTPITNNPENYFNMLYFLDDPITRDWMYYAERYCNMKRIPAKGEKSRCTNEFLAMKGKRSWYDLTENEKEQLKEYIDKYAKKITITNGSSNLDELKDRTSHIYLRREKSELTDLPKKNIIELFYDFNLPQRVEYSRLWDEYCDKKMETDPTAGLNKDLLEIAVYRKYCSNQMIPNTEALIDDYLEGGHKIVVACCYDDELYTLHEKYPDTSVVYNGKMSLKEKDAAKEKFMNDPNIKIFIGNIIAAGVGINLTVSDVLIFNSINYSPSDINQMCDRIYRLGQENDCDIIFQFFRDTETERMWNIIIKKNIIISEVIKNEKEKSS